MPTTSPSRLDRLLFVEDAVDDLAATAGLVDFAGDPVVKSPLTLNYDAFKTSLGVVEPLHRSRGSMLGDAIRVAADAFPEIPTRWAAIVLSDGEDMDSFGRGRGRGGQRHGRSVYTSASATPGRAQDSDVVGGQPTWLKYRGEVWSRMIRSPRRRRPIG